MVLSRPRTCRLVPVTDPRRPRLGWDMAPGPGPLDSVATSSVLRDIMNQPCHWKSKREILEL